MTTSENKLIIIQNLTELFSLCCVWPGMAQTNEEKDWLIKARIQANIATQNFLLGKIDSEEFLDRVEFTESCNMDDYLAEVNETLDDVQDWLTSVNN